MSTCEFCDKKLRVDNKIGACRKHRAQSAARKEYMEEYKTQNLDDIKAYKKIWSKQNRPKLTAQQKQRYDADIQFKLSVSVRNRINKAIKGKIKIDSAVDALGCSLSELKLHLEKQFESGMNWNNHSIDGWHIDHIRPLIMFDLTNKEHFKAACHYTNLRPLWAKENLTRPKRI